MAQQTNLPVMREVTRTPFGERLFQARKIHAKMSQATLAKKIGTSQSNINALEVTGQGSSFVGQMAIVLGVRMEWLATGSGPMLDSNANEQANKQFRHHAGEPATAYGLQDALLEIGRAISATDPANRSDAIDMLMLYFKNPQANEGLVSLIEKRLLGKIGTPTSRISGTGA